MTEEPYRWVEAIANRREYIETQLATGSPIVALSYNDGILFLTVGRDRQKLFEIYDRIAVGAIGHPGDIERLRMAAIELASTEGFTRSTADVSLRRMANYAISPALKSAFEQIYGPPYLARLLFAELGKDSEGDVFLSLDYDGAIQASGASFARNRADFGVISGTRYSAEMMERYLKAEHTTHSTLAHALRTALHAWCVGLLTLKDDSSRELPSAEAIRDRQREAISQGSVEVAVLERSAKTAVTYRTLTEQDLQPLGSSGK